MQQLKERAQQIHKRAKQLRNPPDLSAPLDPQRVVAARRHKVEALERSIGTHEQAAAFQQRQGRPERAAEGRADHERELLAQARAELPRPRLPPARSPRLAMQASSETAC